MRNIRLGVFVEKLLQMKNVPMLEIRGLIQVAADAGMIT
jgi:hypothetical protein